MMRMANEVDSPNKALDLAVALRQQVGSMAHRACRLGLLPTRTLAGPALKTQFVKLSPLDPALTEFCNTIQPPPRPPVWVCAAPHDKLSLLIAVTSKIETVVDS